MTCFINQNQKAKHLTFRLGGSFDPLATLRATLRFLITINFRQPQEGKADMNWNGLRSDRQCWRI